MYELLLCYGAPACIVCSARTCGVPNEIIFRFGKAIRALLRFVAAATLCEALTEHSDIPPLGLGKQNKAAIDANDF